VANWATIAGGKNDQLVELKTSQCSGACLGLYFACTLNT
jgi:hypothetical protein